MPKKKRTRPRTHAENAAEIRSILEVLVVRTSQGNSWDLPWVHDRAAKALANHVEAMGAGR